MLREHSSESDHPISTLLQAAGDVRVQMSRIFLKKSTEYSEEYQIFVLNIPENANTSSLRVLHIYILLGININGMEFWEMHQDFHDIKYEGLCFIFVTFQEC